jgi:hypothetical protein
MAKCAFIGLGNMGGGMAANLAKAGHEVAAFDLSPEALKRAEAAGCKIAATAADAIAEADVVLTMLPAGKHVRAVYEEAAFRAAKPGTLLIDCSTIAVSEARALAEDAAEKGLVAVDAMVHAVTACAGESAGGEADDSLVKRWAVWLAIANLDTPQVLANAADADVGTDAGAVNAGVAAAAAAAGARAVAAAAAAAAAAAVAERGCPSRGRLAA